MHSTKPRQGSTTSENGDVTPEDRAAARALLDDIACGRHVLDLRDDGYGLQHPASCRPNLIDCRVNQALAEGHPGYEPGKYWCDLSDDGVQWTMDPFDDSATDAVLAAIAELPRALDALDAADAADAADARIAELEAALREIAALHLVAPATRIARRALGDAA